MKARPVEAATLPEHFVRTTVANLPVESPRYLTPDYIYLRNETSELYLQAGDLCPNESTVKKLLGLIGIMFTTITDPETNELIDGFVVDLRYVDSVDDFSVSIAEDGAKDEATDPKIATVLGELPIAAIAYKGLDEGEICVRGDMRFANAVLHLTSLAEALNKKLASESSSAEYRRTRILK